MAGWTGGIWTWRSFARIAHIRLDDDDNYDAWIGWQDDSYFWEIRRLGIPIAESKPFFRMSLSTAKQAVLAMWHQIVECDSAELGERH